MVNKVFPAFEVDRLQTRRAWLQSGTCGVLSAAGTFILGERALGLTGTDASQSRGGLEKLGWTLGCQHYTFRRYPLYEAAPIMARLGFSMVEACFFLPLDKDQPGLVVNETLSAEKRAELKQRLQSLGLPMLQFYADLGADEAKAKAVFEFAKSLDVRTIVAEPPAEALGMLDDLTQKFGIDLAIHNHPKSPQSLYWHPKRVMEACHGRSTRIGACGDTGHWVRSGLDPVECLKTLEGRVKTLHLKDVAQWGVPEARDVPLGQGKARYPEVLNELRRQGFRGALSVEYEHDSEHLEREVAEYRSFVAHWADEQA